MYLSLFTKKEQHNCSCTASGRVWCICSAAIDAAEAHPDQNPPWAKNADDAVKDVVRAVVMDVHCAVALWLH